MPGRNRRSVRLAVGGTVVVAVLAAGGVAYARGGSSPGYRTAAVTRGTVSATLDLVGTLAPVRSASVGFAQSGTVASVDVTPGQTVTAGQTLAQLDLTGLRARLTQAQATEASARETLAEAENGQLPAGSGGGQGSSSTGSGRSASAGASTAGITAAQRRVTSAQQGVDRAQATAEADLAAAGRACPTSSSGSSGSSGTSSRDSGTGAPRGSTAGSSAQSAPAAGSDAACLSAERTLLGAQQDLAKQESAVSTAQAALARALGTASSAASTPAASTQPTSAQLAAYQAALDAATAAVAVAQQNLDQGSAVSPLGGTVVSVGMTKGQSVSAGSSTAVITISSPDGYEVTTTVPTASITRVAVGQRASVVPDGSSAALQATVSTIGPAPSSTGYPVTLGLTGSTAGLRQGAAASVRLTTGAAHQGLVVPTSAVRSLGTRHVVEVLSGDTVQPALVTVGSTDPVRTEIVSGLKAGQRVVLADLSSTVTSDSSTTTGGGALAGRGLGGGRFAGAGRGGG